MTYSTSLNMAGALQYGFLLFVFGVNVHKCAVVYEDTKCVTWEPCFDLSIVEMMARHVGNDLADADGENILLKHKSFDKIRGKKDLHSCVLHKIIDLFETALVKMESKSVRHPGEINYHHELIHIMDQLRECVYKTKKGCNKLYKQAYKTPGDKPILKKCDAEQAAVLQLQQLKYASEHLDDVKVQERVMDELKSLHLYMRGKGFLKKEKEERHNSR